MTGRGEEAVKVARRWIGTPYVHQASMRGAGTDCLGLVRGVWRDLYGAEPEPVPAYTADWSEPEGIERLWQAALRHMLPVSAKDPIEVGQVLLFRMRDGAVAKHLGLMSAVGDNAKFIHSFSGYGVLESPLSLPWARRIAARFAFP